MVNNLSVCQLSGWQIFLYLLLFFLQLSGSASDQGISYFSSSSGTFSLGYLESSFSRYVKYSQGFSWFAFALSAMLYRRALAEASRTESMMCQECFPTQKLLMLLSASLLSRGIKASTSGATVCCLFVGLSSVDDSLTIVPMINHVNHADCFGCQCLRRSQGLPFSGRLYDLYKFSACMRLIRDLE